MFEQQHELNIRCTIFDNSPSIGATKIDGNGVDKAENEAVSTTAKSRVRLRRSYLVGFRGGIERSHKFSEGAQNQLAPSCMFLMCLVICLQG